MILRTDRSALDAVGGRLRYLRKLRGMTMAQLATKIGCSESMISKIEGGKAIPSLNTLHRIAQALETNIGQLFDRDGPVGGVVLRRGERPIISGAGRGGPAIRLERMISPDADRLLQGNLHHLDPGASSEGTIAHVGEEFGFVLEGAIALTVGDRSYELEEGDSFHFRSDLPHGYRNIRDVTARILWVNTPPTY